MHEFKKAIQILNGICSTHLLKGGQGLSICLHGSVSQVKVYPSNYPQVIDSAHMLHVPKVFWEVLGVWVVWVVSEKGHEKGPCREYAIIFRGARRRWEVSTVNFRAERQHQSICRDPPPKLPLGFLVNLAVGAKNIVLVSPWVETLPETRPSLALRLKYISSVARHREALTVVLGATYAGVFCRRSYHGIGYDAHNSVPGSQCLPPDHAAKLLRKAHQSPRDLRNQDFWDNWDNWLCWLYWLCSALWNLGPLSTVARCCVHLFMKHAVLPFESSQHRIQGCVAQVVLNVGTITWRPTNATAYPLPDRNQLVDHLVEIWAACRVGPCTAFACLRRCYQAGGLISETPE